MPTSIGARNGPTSAARSLGARAPPPGRARPFANDTQGIRAAPQPPGAAPATAAPRRQTMLTPDRPRRGSRAVTWRRRSSSYTAPPFGLTVVSREGQRGNRVCVRRCLLVAAPDPGPVPPAPSYVQLPGADRRRISPGRQVFSARRGEGLHHVGYARDRHRRGRLSRPSAPPASGSSMSARATAPWAASIAFPAIRPTIGGVLTELVEPPREGRLATRTHGRYRGQWSVILRIDR